MKCTITWATLTLVLLAACQTTPVSEKPNRPNVIFLFADDFTYSGIHSLGNTTIHTPNLDRLRSQGVTFSHAYNMGGWHGAICVASRSMIISGTSLWKAQDVETQWRNGDENAINRTWGRLMQDQGYQTFMTGKWHVQVPPDSVFNTVRNIRPGMPPDYWVGNDSTWRILSNAYRNGEDLEDVLPLGYNRPQSETDTTWLSHDTSHGGFWSGGKHWSEVVKDDALDFLETASQKDAPFFMYLAFNAPHDPRQAPKEFLDLYPLDSISLPENWLPEYPYGDSIGNSPLLRDEALAPYPRTPLAIKTHIREYYGIISHLDEQIGQILKALEDQGLMENTYVFFTGDHGLSVGRHGLLGKQNLYDHSIRVPLFLSGPDIPHDATRAQEVYLQDIMATSLEIAGIEKPQYVDFNSFLDQAQGTSQENNLSAGVYGAYVDFQRMIRKDGFKLLVYPKVNKIMLFDLENDPMEMHDLAADPTHHDQVVSLFADLMKLQDQMEDTLDLSTMYQSLN